MQSQSERELHVHTCRQFSPTGMLPTVKEDLTPVPSLHPSEGVPEYIAACREQSIQRLHMTVWDRLAVVRLTHVDCRACFSTALVMPAGAATRMSSCNGATASDQNSVFSQQGSCSRLDGDRNASWTSQSSTARLSQDAPAANSLGAGNNGPDARTPPQVHITLL